MARLNQERDCTRKDLNVCINLTRCFSVNDEGEPVLSEIGQFDLSKEYEIDEYNPYECENCWEQFFDFEEALEHLKVREVV